MQKKEIRVYHSEIAARWACKAALKRKKAVDTSLFIAWDKFKEEFLSERDETKRPLGKMDKLFFAITAAQENVKNPFLHSLIPEGAGSSVSVVATQIESSLNSLHLLEPRFEGLGNLSQRSELSIIRDKLEEFKQTHGLFEPEPLPYEKISLPPDKSFKLIYPELILDYRDYAGLLADYAANHPEQLSFVHLPRTTPTDFKYQFYPTAMEESKTLLLQIREILTNPSTQNSTILITLADESLIPILEYYAPQYNVPLDFRNGKKLGETLPVYLFKKIKEAVDGNFTFEALQRVFLHQFPSWKNEMAEKNRQLLALASEKLCLMGEESWINAVKGNDDLFEHRSKLFGLFKKMVKASTFEELNGNIQIFLTQYLAMQKIEGNDRKTVERALNTLRQLIEHIKKLPGLEIRSPYDAWLSFLGKSNYVKKSETFGIPVLAYRVAASATPDFHFVCGLSEKMSAVLQEDFSFIPESEKKAWLKADIKHLETDFVTDKSDSYLHAYLYSGEKVFISGSAEIFGQPQIAVNKWFVDKNHYCEHEEKKSDLARQENDFIRYNKGELPKLGSATEKGRLAFMQRLALANASTVNLTKSAISIKNKELISIVQNRFKESWDKEKKEYVAGDIYPFSTTFLDTFAKCPFGAMLRKLIGEDDKKEVVLKDYRLIGNIAHKILENYYLGVKSGKEECYVQHRTLSEDFYNHGQEIATSGKFAGERTGKLTKEARESIKAFRPLLKEKLEALAQAAYEELFVDKKILSSLVREILAEQLVEQCTLQIVNELKDFAGFDVNECEKYYTKSFLSEGYKISGVIDKTLTLGKKNIEIVDYKSGDAPKEAIYVAQINRNEAFIQIPISSFQMLAYKLLLEETLVKQGKLVEGVEIASVYNSLKVDKSDYPKNTVHFVTNSELGKKEVGKGKFDDYAQYNDEIIKDFCEKTVKALDCGDFSIGKTPVCAHCLYESVCRRKFLLK